MDPVILYENLLRSGTLTASGTETGYALNNIVDYKSYTKWKADALVPDPWIEIDFSSPESPDCLGIYNHNFNEVGGTIKLQYDDSGWIDLETIVPNGTYPILISFTAQESAKFRILFDDPVVIPEVAIIFLGNKLQFPYPPMAPVSPAEEQIQNSIEFSEAGHLLGAIISHFPIRIDHQWKNITRTWFDTYFRPFWFNHARYIIPFFYAFDLTNRPNDIYYVTVDPSMRFREVLTILSLTDEINLSMRGISSDKNYSPLSES